MMRLVLQLHRRPAGNALPRGNDCGAGCDAIGFCVYKSFLFLVLYRSLLCFTRGGLGAVMCGFRVLYDTRSFVLCTERCVCAGVGVILCGCRVRLLCHVVFSIYSNSTCYVTGVEEVFPGWVLVGSFVYYT